MAESIGIVVAIGAGIAGVFLLLRFGMDALDRRRGVEPKRASGQSDVLVAFGGLAFIVGLLLVIGGEQVGAGALVGVLGVGMMVAWWVRRTPSESRSR